MDLSNINTLIPVLLAMVPAFVSIVMHVIALLKIFGTGNNSKETIETIQAQINIIHKENIELRKKINELLTQIDHVERE